MSDMTVIISKMSFLNVCIGIEEFCADLYHYYSDIFKDHPTASSLWKKTALEEENHRRQFELALRLIDETEFEVSTWSLKRAHSISYRLGQQVEQIKQQRPELLSATAKALQLEAVLADLHVQTALTFKDESMQALFNSLGSADRDHVADIQHFRSQLYQPLCKTA